MKKVYSLVLLAAFAFSICALFGSSNKQSKKPITKPTRSERVVKK